MRLNKKSPLKSDKTQGLRGQKRGVVGYSKKTALLEEAITQMNAGKYGRSSTALKELLALDPQNMEARRLFATLHLRLGSLIPARQAFDALISEAFQRQDYWLAESLLREYLAAGPRCVPYLEKLGALYQEKGDAVEAVVEYGKAIDILIEDPDTDNPHQASQLYARIRELAPASPIAFRLASSFDTQTGELLARPPQDPEQSAVASSLDRLEGSQGLQESPEPILGIMPWEIQEDHVTTPDSLNLAEVPDSSRLPLAQTIKEHPLHQEPPLDEQVVPSEPLIEELKQVASIASEVRGDAPEETHAQEFGETPSEVQIADLPGHGVLGDFSLLTPSPAPDAKPSEMPSESGLVVSIDDPTDVQEQARVLAEAESACLHDGDGASLVSEPTEPSDVPTFPISTAPSIKEADVISSSQAEAITVPASFEMESPIPEPMKVEDRPLSLQEPIETDLQETGAKQSSDVSASPSPEPVVADQKSEPCKQSEFSWESIFNSAWKVGSTPSAPTPSLELAQATAEETPTPVSATASLQESVPETHVVEISKQAESPTLEEQPASGSSIAPIPWDHVQESVISILQAQGDPPKTEDMAVVVDPPHDQVDPGVTPKASESQVSSPSPNSSFVETDSFSIVQSPQTPVLSEPEVSAGHEEQASSETEKASALAEPEQPLQIVSIPRDETPPSEVSLPDMSESTFENETITENAITPPEVSHKNTDSIGSIEVDRAITADQSRAQDFTPEPVIDLSQSHLEVLSKKNSEIPPPPPLSKQQKTWDPFLEPAEASQSVRKTTEKEIHERYSQKEVSVRGGTSASESTFVQEEQVDAEKSIRFIQQPPAIPLPMAQASPTTSSGHRDTSQSMSVAAVAVEVLFESSQNIRATETRETAAQPKPSRKPNLVLTRARLAIAGFIGSCFSTTRALVVTCVGLVVLAGVLIASGIGAIGLTWLIMEESPSPAFQSLTSTPQRTLSDFKKNGYFLLLGIDAPVGQDPIQVGYDRKPDAHDGSLAGACFGGSESKTVQGSNASANAMRGWVRSSSPVGEFKTNRETITKWSEGHQSSLNHYGQWHKLPFEDWGYGQAVAPPCTAMVFAHQLHVADGFLQGTDLGIDRLEADMEAWRIVLGQARTLAVKMLALQAINDDIAVTSGILVSPDFDGKYLGRVTKLLRPLDQGELSMRWPMQSELVSASKTYETQLSTAKTKELPLHAAVAAALPLPMQRRLNDYAEYYDESYKAAGEGRYGSLPKWKSYIHFPASGVMDYVTNPIENIVGLEPLPPWDLHNGLVVDTDAHLRLASLQAWLRRGSADGDLVTRMVKAGQDFYDPYTGMPMLVNLQKGVLYSVGHDGKDQDADPQLDVVVEIPATHTSTASSKSR